MTRKRKRVLVRRLELRVPVDLLPAIDRALDGAGPDRTRSDWIRAALREKAEREQASFNARATVLHSV